jgi:hypothetical protein
MDPPSIAERTAAREWLKSLNVLLPEEAQIDTVLKQWRIWKDTTPAAREANLALELKNISPPPEDARVVALNRRQDLKEISRANLERLKEKILTRIPVAREPDGPLLNDVKSMSEDLAFHYLRPFRERSATGVNAPLAGSRELARLGLDFAPSCYSQRSIHDRGDESESGPLFLECAGALRCAPLERRLGGGSRIRPAEFLERECAHDVLQQLGARADRKSPA